MISLLLWLLVAVVLMYIAYLLAIKFIADGTLRTVVLLILGLIFLFLILGHLGVIPGVNAF